MRKYCWKYENFQFDNINFKKIIDFNENFIKKHKYFKNFKEKYKIQSKLKLKDSMLPSKNADFLVNINSLIRIKLKMT